MRKTKRGAMQVSFTLHKKKNTFDNGLKYLKFTYECELGSIGDINVVAQKEASSPDQWDLSPGKDNIRVLLTG